MIVGEEDGEKGDGEEQVEEDLEGDWDTLLSLPPPLLLLLFVMVFLAEEEDDHMGFCFKE